MRRWRVAHRWSGAAALPTDELTALTMRQELEAIVDRRLWEPDEPRKADVAAVQPAGGRDGAVDRAA
jgi:hypothetical protein